MFKHILRHPRIFTPLLALGMTFSYIVVGFDEYPLLSVSTSIIAYSMIYLIAVGMTKTFDGRSQSQRVVVHHPDSVQ